MRTRLPWWLLALLFVGVPLLEVYLIVQLGQVIGAWWTILLIIGAGVLGTYLIKREGSRAWRALQQALAEHRMPARELADGALVLIGGTLLLTPGFVTDAVGLACVLPFTRPLGRRVLTRVVARRLVVAPPFGPPGSEPGRTARRPGHDDVVRGEVVDDD